MPDKTKRSGVGQAWLAQRVGVTLYSALFSGSFHAGYNYGLQLLPRHTVSKTSVFETVTDRDDSLRIDG